MIDLAGFALAVLLIELTPGPNMGWLVTLTLAEGRRAGLGAIIGIALGLSANAALSVLAASIILAQGPAQRGARANGWLEVGWGQADQACRRKRVRGRNGL